MTSKAKVKMNRHRSARKAKRKSPTKTEKRDGMNNPRQCLGSQPIIHQARIEKWLFR